MTTRRRFALAAAALLAAGGRVGAQPAKIPRIGVLRTAPRGDRQFQGFLLGLRELGHVEGKTIAIDYRQGEAAKLDTLARDLVAQRVDLIFAPTPPDAQAAKRATDAIPIVIAVVGDVIGTGLAASLARPGGNVTGLTALGSNLSGKRLELLKEIKPGLSRVAVLWNPGIPDKVIEWKEIQGPANAMKLELLSVEVRSPQDFEPAFEALRGLRPDGLIALGEPLVFVQRRRIADFALQGRVATVFNWREAVEDGALIAYGPDIADLYRRAALYVDKILRGAKPGDLPIEEPTRFDFVVNLKTARALGLTIPQTLLARADKVIE
ncbi:MAG TPA: ABC transporter substrate-binding protein [Burkholderiales bacterium]|nr:ABC transporter substrate-binding protein [Burkholderiales bacterium]